MTLREDIESALNRHSAENFSNTPDFVLARFLMGCLKAFDAAVIQREVWFGREPNLPASASPPAAVHNGE